ncbi:hypothetical protein HG530_015119 [Fusarium avenaceum]|nr:hypothetical protein HG530_015119 [Fusarium avenaceum]
MASSIRSQKYTGIRVRNLSGEAKSNVCILTSLMITAIVATRPSAIKTVMRHRSTVERLSFQIKNNGIIAKVKSPNKATPCKSTTYPNLLCIQALRIRNLFPVGINRSTLDKLEDLRADDAGSLDPNREPDDCAPDLGRREL